MPPDFGLSYTCFSDCYNRDAFRRVIHYSRDVTNACKLVPRPHCHCLMVVFTVVLTAQAFKFQPTSDNEPDLL